MKWNGRYYRPGYGINVYPKKQDSIEELLKPLSEKTKKGNIWIPVILNVLKDESTPVPTSSPTPTPTGTPTPTPSSSSIPVSPSPTPTETSTPTPTPSLEAISVNFLSFSSQTTNSTTFIYEDVSITKPGLIVVNLAGQFPVTFGEPTVMINGNSATLAVGRSAAADRNFCYIFYYRVTSGTTVDIQVDFPYTQSQCILGLHRIDGLLYDTPYQTQTKGATGTIVTDNFLSLPIDSVGVMSHCSLFPIVSWSLATSSYETSAEGIYGAGARFKTTSSGNRDVSVTITNSGNGNQLVGAVWSNTI